MKQEDRRLIAEAVEAANRLQRLAERAAEEGDETTRELFEDGIEAMNEIAGQLLGYSPGEIEQHPTGPEENQKYNPIKEMWDNTKIAQAALLILSHHLNRTPNEMLVKIAMNAVHTIEARIEENPSFIPF